MPGPFDQAVNPTRVVVGRCLGYQQVLAATLAASTALTVPAGATAAYVQAEVGAVRYTHDGTTVPTAAIGGRVGILPMDGMWFTSSLDQLRFILEGAGAILNVHYY